MARVLRDGRPHGIDDRVARTFSAQEFDVFRPWKRDQDAHTGRGAAIEKPERWGVINAQDVQADLPHLREIAVQLFWSAEIMPIRVRLEWPVGYALDEKLVGRLRRRISRQRERDPAEGNSQPSSLV